MENPRTEKAADAVGGSLGGQLGALQSHLLRNPDDSVHEGAGSNADCTGDADDVAQSGHAEELGNA
ncbi:hypothetical protein Pmar_PMAR017305 [Perkinsus marinus ATCC 50983]|uniref:Uncharacterized protein n=1 Tax=Perkinsus marinus (strain ATCC 50983 / TXsc) TaxID=423536 RepID=C5LH82_PERM5|nr:hypothetical protein Pmar_PMAR017305 [Perkinsus marinus ATCC 50983]EER03891.1 hypothetical protein Pmar_PMAR017305 [Perkinsus marinus ATCC 50983]|eukprot:XP_002772075.1 hypothetical protein Pmar_PMAR017305 [Perkinsus marinus ATCC 50983]